MKNNISTSNFLRCANFIVMRSLQQSLQEVKTLQKGDPPPSQQLMGKVSEIPGLKGKSCMRSFAFGGLKVHTG